MFGRSGALGPSANYTYLLYFLDLRIMQYFCFELGNKLRWGDRTRPASLGSMYVCIPACMLVHHNVHTYIVGQVGFHR